MGKFDWKLHRLSPCDYKIGESSCAVKSIIALLAAGTLRREVRDNTPWYSRADADPTAAAARLAELIPLHRQYQRLGHRISWIEPR
jgi:hypothetical protein